MIDNENTWAPPTRDTVPTLDDETPQANYQDWRPEDTVVITYAIGDNGFKGIQVETRDEARAHCKLIYGRILEANYVDGRAFLRVKRMVK